MTLKDQYNQRQAENQAKINDTYAKQYDAQANQLKTEYDRAMSDKQAALGQIAPQYQNQANSLAARYEQTRRNANLGAMVGGTASGTAQQQQNALSNQYVGNYGALRGEEAAAVNSANQDIANLTTAYNDNLAKTRASINAKRDQDIINADNKDREWYENQAQVLANSGNFDAYKDIYGEAQANNMRNTWISQNPVAAFRAGMISADDYKKITGKDISSANSKDKGIYANL